METYIIILIFFIALSAELAFLAWRLSELQEKIKLLQYWILQNRKEINRMIIFPLPDIEDPWKEKAHKRRADT